MKTYTLVGSGQERTALVNDQPLPPVLVKNERVEIYNPLRLARSILTDAIGQTEASLYSQEFDRDFIREREAGTKITLAEIQAWIEQKNAVGISVQEQCLTKPWRKVA